MTKQLLTPLLILVCLASCENRYRRANVSSGPDASVDAKFSGQTSDDAYQVSQQEYDDNFVSRYGLLYLKSSNDPFSGRILTVDAGKSGEYVSSDESWKEGRKHGKSSKWFSNGIKMYERNYREGRWHGSVTRWWPNGQKMYVRAYTNGVRHGSESSWRSDGSPLSLPADGAAPAMDNDLKPASTESINSLPNVDLSEPVETPNSSDQPVESQPVLQEPFDAPLPVIPEPGPEPKTEPVPETVDDGFSDLPSFPPMEEEVPSLEPDETLPDLPSSDESLPIFPNDPDTPVEATPALPELPSVGSDSLPEIPGLGSDVPNSGDADLLLPGLPVEPESEEGGLPPLPGMEDDGGLPPLPGSDEGGLGDLPPLPPLP
jgi:hypothetical protein